MIQWQGWRRTHTRGSLVIFKTTKEGIILEREPIWLTEKQKSTKIPFTREYTSAVRALDPTLYDLH